MGVEKRVFVRKSSGANLYKWSPSPNDVTKRAGGNVSPNKKPYFCSAIPNTQGEDWITTYTYNVLVINGNVQHIAYVQCDYVQ